MPTSNGCARRAAQPRNALPTGPLANLLNAVGASLKPKVFCVGELADQGAGHPDFGLYGAKRVQPGRPRKGQIPERGIVEVKAVDDDAWLTAAGDQVSRYWGRYRLVLVTNTRDFVLVGEDAAGRPAKLETFRLADSADDFRHQLEKPRALARAAGTGLGEYLARALLHRASLAEPKDLAWLLASYARDGLAQVEAAGDSPALAAVREALEDALGVRFKDDRQHGRVVNEPMWVCCSMANLLPVISIGTLPSGTCERPFSPPCFNNCRILDGCSRSASSMCSTGPPTDTEDRRPVPIRARSGRRSPLAPNPGSSVPAIAWL